MGGGWHTAAALILRRKGMMKEGIYLPASALAKKQYPSMPMEPGMKDEATEVMPAVGDKVSIQLNGKVTGIKNGLACIENLVSDGHAIEWPSGDNAQGDGDGQDAEGADDAATEGNLADQAKQSEQETVY
jgi:hypothetical protein